MLVSAIGFQKNAHAEGYFHIDEIARRSTVKISGATQGSGVLVSRDGSQYTILTAWHVIGSNTKGEDIDLEIDGQRYSITYLPGQNIKRIGDLDLAVVSLSSSNTHHIPRLQNANTIVVGDVIAVAGFPLKDPILGIGFGGLVASADVGVDQGYQLLYTSVTKAGMSGGPVFSGDGSLIGIHGRGERKAGSTTDIKTGVNQGIPIWMFNEYRNTGRITKRSRTPVSYDDYYALAINAGRIQQPQTMIRLANAMKSLRPSRVDAYFIAQHAAEMIGDTRTASESKELIHNLFKKYHDTIMRAFGAMQSPANPAEALRLVDIAQGYGGNILNGYAETNYIKALAYYTLGDYRKSLSYLNPALKTLEDKGKTNSLFFEGIIGGWFGRTHLLVIKSDMHYKLGEYGQGYLTVDRALDSDLKDDVRAVLLISRASYGSRLDKSLDEVCIDYNKALALGITDKESVSQLRFIFACTSGKEQQDFYRGLSAHLCEQRLKGIDEQTLLSSMSRVFQDELTVSRLFANQLLAKIMRKNVLSQCPSLFKSKLPR